MKASEFASLSLVEPQAWKNAMVVGDLVRDSSNVESSTWQQDSSFLGLANGCAVGADTEIGVLAEIQKRA